MKPKISVYKFTSCDGCQLAFLNADEALLELSHLVDITHFAEAGYLDKNEFVDIAFVEGSISTKEEEIKIKKIRESSRFLITIGACATAGGIQALRNFANYSSWLNAIYATPDTIHALSSSTAISKHVKVDFEIWGCPVNTRQVLQAIRFLLWDVAPFERKESVCMECKRQKHICVLVTKKSACMGPVTQTGCGALCPSVGRACYACYGPKENANTTSLGRRFEGFGLMPEEIAKQFAHINNQAEAFLKAKNDFEGK